MSNTTQLEQDAYTLEHAMKAAVELAGIREERFYDVVAAAGHDATLAFLGDRWFKSEVSYRREKRTSFSLCTSVEVRMSCRHGDTEPTAKVDVSWSSGGGTPGHALAVLTHHMEMLKGASQAEVILAEAVRSVRTAERFKAAMEQVSLSAEAAQVAARPVVEAHVAAIRVARGEV